MTLIFSVRFAITGAPTIQLFTSKDSELLQRVHNLKKLSFLIYCGDVDHYKHCMPQIQGMCLSGFSFSLASFEVDHALSLFNKNFALALVLLTH